MLRYIAPARENIFKLVFGKDRENNIAVEGIGNISVEKDVVRLTFGRNNSVIGWRTASSFMVQTLGRNMVPLYVRTFGDEVWISNDLSALIVDGEVVSIRVVELLFAAINSAGIKSVMSHLLDKVSLLLPSSLYSISPSSDGGVSCHWSAVAFKECKITRAEFLEVLLDQYKSRFEHEEHVCLALSGGYDSRLELAILRHLGKQLHCFHYKRFRRERALAAEIAELAGASFHVIDQPAAVQRGWRFLQELGYTTRWDGFFAAGAIPAAGLYMEMAQAFPDECKQLLNTGQWKGLLYNKADVIFEHWQNIEAKTANQLLGAFPEFRRTIQLEHDRRKAFVEELERKIRSKADRPDIITDISYHMMYKSAGKMATRTTFLYENDMPVLTGEQQNRNRFNSLVVDEKEGTSFLHWAIQKLDPRLSERPWITSSQSVSERRFGLFGQLLQSLVRKEYRAPRAEIDIDLWSAPEVEAILLQHPELRGVFAQAPIGGARLYLAMIARFLRALQSEKVVTFTLAQ